MSPAIVTFPDEVSEAGSLWFEVALNGVILLDPADRIARILSKIRQAIADGRLVGMEPHGHLYRVRREQVA